jgi:hypothetical protein
MEEAAHDWWGLVVASLGVLIVVAALWTYGRMISRERKRIKQRRTGEPKYNGDPTIPSR